MPADADPPVAPYDDRIRGGRTGRTVTPDAEAAWSDEATASDHAALQVALSRAEAAEAQVQSLEERVAAIDQEADELEQTIISLEKELDEANAELYNAQFKEEAPDPSAPRAAKKNYLQKALEKERRRLERRHNLDLDEQDANHRKQLERLQTDHAGIIQAMETEQRSRLKGRDQRITALEKEVQALQDALRRAQQRERLIIDQAARDIADARIKGVPLTATESAQVQLRQRVPGPKDPSPKKSRRRRDDGNRLTALEKQSKREQVEDRLWEQV